MNNILFLTEMNFTGKIPNTHPNMRVEFAWMNALNADHNCLFDLSKINQKYDLGIVILPKKNINRLINLNLIDQLKQYCNKIAYMQEGPYNYWQDYTMVEQIWFYNFLTSCDIIYTHNIKDILYFKGLTNHPDVRVMPSLMIEESLQGIKLTEKEDRNGVMIGGNMCSWYGGFDSMIVAQEFKDEQVYAPSMGRKIEGEDQLDINYLPYMQWRNWIGELSKRKYGIHLMPTQAAGTFALNCAYLGIPCIGYKGLDTQEICHPSLTVEVGDLVKAKFWVKHLQENPQFYEHCSIVAKENYKQCFSKQTFLKKFYGYNS